MNKKNGKTMLVRTAQSHQDEKENAALCMEIMGFKYEHEMTRHHIMRQVRILHETVNDLVVELFAQNPNHVIFKNCPSKTIQMMCDIINKRENGNNWGFGAPPRTKLNF
jgi:hypothetical protein